MDEGLSKAVISVFVKLYKEGLIYRDKRLVNWDPKLLTAISDLEVEQKEVEGKFWYFKYPLENSDEFLTIATTRPETMLGDTAVAVNPDDERYIHLKGKYVILPIINRRIPIIFDNYSDPEKGYFKIWVNGNLKVDEKGQTIWKTHGDVEKYFGKNRWDFKFGIYTTSKMAFKLYFDEI